MPLIKRELNATIDERNTFRFKPLLLLNIVWVRYFPLAVDYTVPGDFCIFGQAGKYAPNHAGLSRKSSHRRNLAIGCYFALRNSKHDLPDERLHLLGFRFGS